MYVGTTTSLKMDKFEDGQVCVICGHQLWEVIEKRLQHSTLYIVILLEFWYLGSYASQCELLKA